ncbi:BTAD domain-containing putative transcriptional regulator [Planotetraspora phitsanulokensis]|uniref:SARP family transcriptional regulator n=1 Tax=Planotetraspora phitsanulokensis TaxID=575192 RepID=A0A8J3U490_9ACTN|nr:BTAD domain-containing putative transcriptional regulator [Planotetraspora phitsanulokensis]GII38308.1 SARP family transcriptional regulator [Planotetraspora phitsanulokensis]
MQGVTLDTGVSFAVLGPLEVREDGRLIEIGGQRLRALLTLLLLDTGRTVPTDVLVAGVWDDRPPNGVGNALQALVSRLRGTIDRTLVVADPSGYRLLVPPDQVDLHRFTRLAREGGRALETGDPGLAVRVLTEGLRLWRGAPLTDLPVGGVEVARLEEIRIAATEDRIDAELRLGQFPEVVSELSRLIAAHPLRERLRGLLMRALYGSGRQVEALAAYEDARVAFAERFGADPSPALAELHLSILRGDGSALRGDGSALRGDGSALGGDGSALRGPDEGEPQVPPRVHEPVRPLDAPPARKGNLRARLTSFVGREGDVEQAGELLARNRLVTLLGPGGAGKTRLAVESAEAFAPSAPDGVWLVELASVVDPAQVPRAVLAALGLRDMGLVPVRSSAGPAADSDATDRLVTALAGRSVLIVLDNCEHLVNAAAILADRLLADCPGIRILVTSREPLGITGEVLWPVQPLGLDHAVRLFADRAAAARPGYRAQDDRDAVERICRGLDGMPLAIELAAARLRTLSADGIADRLSDRFHLLTSGSRTAMPRHQTLRAVVEWSWDLLDDGERTLAARLSVFAGGATLESAEEVCRGDLDVLGRLVDKSLVVFDGGRYSMLETVRAYAGDRLAETGDEREIRMAHARFFAEMAETADPHLRRAEQVEWLPRLWAEHDNLTSALLWATDQGEADVALALVGNLGWYWWLVGQRREGAQRAEEVLRMAEGADPEADPVKVALAHAVLGLTWAAADLQWDRAKDSLKTAIRLLRDHPAPDPPHPMVAMAAPILALLLSSDREANARLEDLFGHPDPWVVAAAYMFRGNMAFNSGRVAEGEADLRASLELFREVGDRWGMGNALASLAEAGTMRGSGEAIEILREAIALVDEVGAVEDTPYMRTRLAIALNIAGDRAAAAAVLQEAMRICVDNADLVGKAGVEHVRGDFAREAGDFDAARECYHEALRLLGGPEMSSARQFQATLSASLGMLAAQEGDLRRARRLHGEALALAVESQDGPVVAHVIVAYACLAAVEGDHESAAVLLGGATAVRGIVDVVGFDHVRATEAAKAALGGEEFSRCYERGRAMTREQVVVFAG